MSHSGLLASLPLIRINKRMNNKFYLYVKQHRITRLKYFGMTATKDPYVYQGSGKHWRRHLKVHGKDIETIQVWEFNNIETCEQFALNFSKENNIWVIDIK